MLRTAENSRLTDSVAESDLQTAGGSASVSGGDGFQASCELLATSAMNAADEGMRIFMISHASNARGVGTILGSGGDAPRGRRRSGRHR